MTSMKARTAQKLRTWHQYIGLFFTPAIIFFSLSGALQTIGLHESHGASPPPQEWIAWMASVHKDQRVTFEDHDDNDHDHPKAAAEKPKHDADADEEKERGEGPSPIPLKVFTVLLSIALIASSVLGTIIALNNRVSRRKSLIALGLGVIVPLLLGVL
jgi:hypothetical protein